MKICSKLKALCSCPLSLQPFLRPSSFSSPSQIPALWLPPDSASHVTLLAKNPFFLMESHGSQWRRNLKRKPLFDLTNTTRSLSSSSDAVSLLKPNPKPKPKPKSQSSNPTPPQSSNPGETFARSNSDFNAGGPEDHAVQIVATPSPRSRETLDSVDDPAQHDKSKHSIVYTRQTAERRCKEREAGRCQEKEAGRRCKEKAVPSTALSCPPAGRSRSIKGKLVMDNDKVDHPKAFSVPYKKAKKKHHYTMSVAISKPVLPQDFIEKQKAYFAEVDAFELPEVVVSESELE